MMGLEIWMGLRCSSFFCYPFSRVLSKFNCVQTWIEAKVIRVAGDGRCELLTTDGDGGFVVSVVHCAHSNSI